jgi:hypothetical protein
MLLQRIDFAIKNRINPEIYFSAEDLDACQEKDVRQLAEILHRNELEISLHGPFMDLSPGGVDKRIKEVTLDRLTKVIELALFLKPKTIVFHPGYEKWKFDGDVELWLKSSLQTWRPLVREAEEMGLVIAIEMSMKTLLTPSKLFWRRSIPPIFDSASTPVTTTSLVKFRSLLGLKPWENIFVRFTSTIITKRWMSISL